MSGTNDELERTWECDWVGHELAQLRRWAQLPFWEKLEWLEQAQQMVEHMHRARSKVSPVEGAPDSGASDTPEQLGSTKS